VRTPEFDTVILAGGRASRMGGADKPALIVGNEPMVVSVARAAAAAGTRSLIVVGPRREGAVLDALTAVAGGLAGGVPDGVRGGVPEGMPGGVCGGSLDGAPGGLRFALEEPPGAGPVAALRSGLAGVTAPWLALLAADLPFLLGAQLTDLFGQALGAGRAGAVLADADGRPQWLAGGWQADVLRAALQGYQGSSLHGLLAPLEPVAVQSAGRDEGFAPWMDCDTPAELTVARLSWQFRRTGAIGEA
jgi:molybdopterin-guanine dinucleotide biosynthesis protein A